jgi:hypothetical protein
VCHVRPADDDAPRRPLSPRDRLVTRHGGITAVEVQRVPCQGGGRYTLEAFQYFPESEFGPPQSH